MKKILVCIVLTTILLCENAQGQNSNRTASGQVTIENSDEGVPYATITIQNDSARVINRVATDGNGKFNIQFKNGGNYTLIASAVGLTEANKKIQFNGSETKLDVGKIEMKEGVQLKEVVVAAQKPLIKSETDKLVYSVESDPEAKTSTAFDIIRKVPLLATDGDDNVTLNGQTNYKVLVNGKSSGLMTNNFKDVIKSMPANSIKDIEVITTPSSKYEAEGVGGIINIITQKNRDNGYSGNVGVSGDRYGGVGGNAYVAAKIDKVTFNIGLFSNHFRMPEAESNSRRENFQLEDAHYNHVDSKTKYNGLSNSLSFEFGYEIDTFNLISAAGWGFLGNSKNNSSSVTQDFTRSFDPFRRYSLSSEGKSTFGMGSANIDYQRTFKRPNKTFTASYKYEMTPNNSWFENNVIGELNYPSYRQKSDNKAGNNNHTVQLDFYDPITDKHQYEAGVKYILRLNDSETDVSMYDNSQGKWVIDPSRNNDLDYKQHILGAYLGYVYKLKKFSTKAGMRIEQTWNDGTFKTTVSTPFVNNYFNWIPYITLTYNPKPTQTIKLSYTQRLSRPGIWYLNPYVNDQDPQNIRYGNPNLSSEISHAVEANFSTFNPKYNISLTGGGSILDNAIEQFSFIDDKGRSNTTYANIGSRQMYYVNLYGSYRPTPKFNIGGFASVRYTIIDSNGDLKRHNEGTQFNFNLNARHTLWKDAAVSIFGGVHSPFIMLQGKGSLFYYSSINLTQQLLNKKLDITLGISDPFPAKKRMKTTMSDITYSSVSENYQWGQRAFIRINYRFGKMNIQTKKARRGINNDDMKSGGDNAQGGTSTAQ